jgi:hypothetical protein
MKDKKCDPPAPCPLEGDVWADQAGQELDPQGLHVLLLREERNVPHSSAGATNCPLALCTLG